MNECKDTNEYEKLFLKKYLKNQADKKIAELEERLKNTTDSFKILEIKRQISQITSALDKELKKLDDDTELGEKIETGEKAQNIEKYNPSKVFLYGNIQIPLNIWNYLFEYQKQGVIWMLDLFKSKKGGILADEMGLGKTIQVCTVIISLFHSNIAEQFLILCPATVIDHWIAHFEKLECHPKIYRDISIKNTGIFVISYETFRNSRILPKFDCVFLDEGHKIKNKDSQISNSVKMIQTQSRFVITGTPIQNDLSELWSIFSFVNSTLLGSYSTFQEEFEKKIQNCRTEKEKQISYQYSVMLRAIIEPFILRRTKNSVKHILPNKIDKVIFIGLSEKQTQMYLNALDSKKFEILLKTGFRSKNTLFRLIMHLKKICNHPLLVENKNTECLDLDNTDDSNPYPIEISEIKDEIIEDSCKLKTVFDLLDQWYSENNKVLLFFQTVQMLEIARTAISKFRKKFNFLIMNGKTPISQRTSMIDMFNNDPTQFLFLLTTKVGGLGLNLTGANRVIIYDPDWNPSTDNQAKERIYRYGQKSDVEIYRMICRDTIEEKIYQKQIYKDCLSKKILSSPDVRFDAEYFSDFFTFKPGMKNETEIKLDKNFIVKDDKLVDIKEEDKRDFDIIKAYNLKGTLTGKELIEFIKRRENSLNT